MDLPTILKYGDATLMAALDRVPESAREAAPLPAAQPAAADPP